MISRRCFLSILATVFATNLPCQIPDLTFRELNQLDGLSEMRNAYLSETSDGRIWIGSFDGLNVFDGKRAKVIRPQLPDGGVSPNISSQVWEDHQGTRWFSSSGAIHRFARSDKKPTTVMLEKPPGDASKLNPEHVLIHLEQNSKLWIIAYDWLHIYNIQTGKDSLLHPLSGFSCYPLLDKNGKVSALVNLLAAEGSGIELFDYQSTGYKKSRWFTGNDQAGFPKAFIMFACVEADSLLWLPSNIGLIRFPVHTPRNYRVFRPEGMTGQMLFKDVAAWREHLLFVASEQHGLFLFDTRAGREGFITNLPFITTKDGQKHLNIHKILVGRDETIWLSIWGKGICFTSLKPSKFTPTFRFKPSGSGKNQSVTTLAEDKYGNIWTANMEGELGLISAAGRPLPVSRQGLEGTYHKIFIDRQGDLWAYNQQAVFFKRSSDTRFSKVAFQLHRLYKILQYTDGMFLLVCPEGIFTLKKGERLRNFARASPLLPLPNVFNAFADSAGTLYISDEIDKLWIYARKRDSFEQIREINGTGYVNGMIETGSLRWFATSKGLFKLDLTNGSMACVKDKAHLLETSLTAILCDQHRALWLSSNTGLITYAPGSGQLKQYTPADGLQGMQFLEGSACRLSKGCLAFGGANGMNVFHPDSVRDNLDPPLLHFTELIVNDTGSIAAYPGGDFKLSFNYDKRTLSFHFIGIDYSAPDEVQYRYRLKGFEKDTVEAGTNGFARYAQLPAGNYTFQVWAANSDGVWTSRPLELQFTILPPWYATWWAYSLWLILISGLLYAFYRNRINHIRRKERAKSMEAEFRQKEAEGKQLAAELQNAVLRLQMNPHFIFNSMNSISSYMLQKDVETANDYLSRFARLMRLILELAAKPFIAVSDEIEWLEQYMVVEAMRFEHKFTWEIHIDPQLEPDEIRVPTMILQPFVENAIWHGFSPKTRSGLIQIAFLKQEESLLCLVRDNGIGRKESAKLRTGTHPSKAVQITAKRLQMLENQLYDRCDLNITDLYDAAGNAAGTKVEIRLPLEL